jgi:hypothetical protein
MVWLGIFRGHHLVKEAQKKKSHCVLARHYTTALFTKPALGHSHKTLISPLQHCFQPYALPLIHVPASSAVCDETTLANLPTTDASDLFLGEAHGGLRYGDVDATAGLTSCASICAMSKKSGIAVAAVGSGQDKGKDGSQQCVAFAITQSGGVDEECLLLHKSGPEAQRLSTMLDKYNVAVGQELWLYSIGECLVNLADAQV